MLASGAVLLAMTRPLRSGDHRQVFDVSGGPPCRARWRWWTMGVLRSLMLILLYLARCTAVLAVSPLPEIHESSRCLLIPSRLAASSRCVVSDRLLLTTECSIDSPLLQLC